MCRHICPIGNATGQERNTARARALTLSLVNRSAAELTPDIIDNIYECALCGACTKECATGWDPVAFTKETRTELALNGLLPEYINKMLDNYDSAGNIYGKVPDTSKYATSDSDTLFFLGMDARQNVPITAIELLKLANAGFTMLENEPDSGYTFDTIIGAADETKQIMIQTAEILNGYSRIIVYDPADAKTFIREYKEWGIELKPQIITFTAFLASLIKEGKLKPKKLDISVTYQDPALLAREVGETEEARYIIGKCAELNEMLLNRRDTMFGGNMIMNEYMHDVIMKTACERFKNAEDTGVKTVVTASPSEYAVMNEAKPNCIDVMPIETLLLKACKTEE